MSVGKTLRYSAGDTYSSHPILTAKFNGYCFDFQLPILTFTGGYKAHGLLFLMAGLRFLERQAPHASFYATQGTELHHIGTR